MEDLRGMIRELLAEELARVRNPSSSGTREEVVRIENDRDLAAFARRVLEIAGNGAGAEDIRRGRLVFRLQRGGSPDSPLQPGDSVAGGARSHRIETIAKKLITERDINNLPDSAGVLSIDRQSRLTPLAQDELRRRGIKIQRKTA